MPRETPAENWSLLETRGDKTVRLEKSSTFTVSKKRLGPVGKLSPRRGLFPHQGRCLAASQPLASTLPAAARRARIPWKCSTASPGAKRCWCGPKTGRGHASPGTTVCCSPASTLLLASGGLRPIALGRRPAMRPAARDGRYPRRPVPSRGPRRGPPSAQHAHLLCREYDPPRSARQHSWWNKSKTAMSKNCVNALAGAATVISMKVSTLFGRCGGRRPMSRRT